jgi:hypothetical protein
MFENNIIFRCHPEYLKWSEDNQPVPVSTNLPKWYKKLSHSWEKLTIKGCMPFLDTITTGYIIKTPQDYYVKLKPKKDPKPDEDPYDFVVDASFSNAPNYLKAQAEKIGVNFNATFHPYTQLEGSPMLERNLSPKFFKFDNPWIIETPPGYSCLFLPLLNNNDDRFEILPGIVDTDVYEHRVQFPCVFNGWKYKNGYEGTIKKGTPIVQIIPFKREKWKMKIKTISNEELAKVDFSFTSSRFKFIRSKWHKKITK